MYAATTDPRPASALPDEGEVLLWRVLLDRPPREIATMRGLLSAEEAHRAERFRFKRHAARFVVGRAILRRILATALDEEPGHLSITTTARGKPILLPRRGRQLYFNLSHAGPVALYALTRCGPVGVDIERYTITPHMDRLAARVFTPEERAAFRAIPPDRRPAAFLAGWTRKEALLKATGQGIADGLSTFEVSMDPMKPARILRCRGLDQGPWSLSDVAPLAGHMGALAVRASAVRVRWALDDENCCTDASVLAAVTLPRRALEV